MKVIRDERSNALRAYVWGEGIDRLLAVKVGGRTYTALTDVQGTVWGYADESGAVVARWTYDAWGNVLSEEVAPSAEALRTVRYRFQGRERSAATGLVNFRMRWCDPATGRWLAKDPIGLGGGVNLYAFCGGDPLNSIDPYGLAHVGSRPLDAGKGNTGTFRPSARPTPFGSHVEALVRPQVGRPLAFRTENVV